MELIDQTCGSIKNCQGVAAELDIDDLIDFKVPKFKRYN